jgi:alpha-L-fucosidase
MDTIVKLELDGPASSIQVPPPDTRSSSLAFGKKATASDVYKNQPEFGPDKAFDDNPETRWGCDWGTKSAWLEVDLGEAKTFNRAWISEPYDRVQAFELQVKQGGEWRTFHRGRTIGESFDIKFVPVTGRHVRLNLLKTTEGPSIWEFQLFATEKP